MAQFVLDIPDSAAQRIAFAVCSRDGYTPLDMADAIERTKTHVFRYLAATVIEQEANAAAVAAADTVRGNADDPLAAALFTPVAPPAPEPPAPDPGPVGPVGPVDPGITGSTSFQAILRR